MADRIVVIQDSRIAELSTHDKLMCQEGTYARLFSMQADGYRCAGLVKRSRREKHRTELLDLNDP